MLRALRMALCILSLAMATVTFWSHAEEPQQSMMMPDHDPVAITLISEEESVQPGHPFWIGIHLNIDQDWHAYWKNPGDAGMPPAVTWNLPEGFTAEPLLWPTPKRFTLGASVGFGYDNEMVLLAKITPPASYSANEIDIKADIRWVVCSDSACLPGDSDVHLTLPISAIPPQVSSSQASIFAKARQQIPQKNEGMNAERKDHLIELTFNDKMAQDRLIEKVEFFPENHKAIDYKTEAVVQRQSDNTYSLLLNEASATPSLKGILVLRTAHGTEAYDVDLPISGALEKDVISMADNKEMTETASQKPAPFAFEGGVGMAILFAFLGGMILNLMPCVLPVISFKILSFVKLAGENRKEIFKHGLAFSFGVLLSFWVLAGVLLILQAYGRSVGWGFQLQEPIFVAVLAAFLFMFGLSLFGLFELGTSILAVAGQAQNAGRKKSGMIASFLSGILATAVATPCTGPFLGTAVGFAFTLPAYQAMLIFTSLGLGMSFPYLAFAAFPSLLRFLPKPGPWMITFKELMGFFMIATVLWLVWVFSAQAGSFATILLLAGFFILSIGGWIFGRWCSPVKKKLTHNIAMILTLVCLSYGSYVIVLSTSSWAEAMGGTSITATTGQSEVADVWETFSPERVEELRKQGIPVFVDFTAKWCLICQANHLVLSGDEVAEKFASLGVVRMKADWTKNDDIIAAELRKFGRSSVPLYVLYGTDPDAQPQILPQVLTPDVVMTSLKGIEETL